MLIMGRLYGGKDSPAIKVILAWGSMLRIVSIADVPEIPLPMTTCLIAHPWSIKTRSGGLRGKTLPTQAPGDNSRPYKARGKGFLLRSKIVNA
jgi:hypothetical protein